MAMDHDVVVPADSIPCILESLADLHQLFCREQPVGEVASRVHLRVRMQRAVFMAGKSGLVRLYLRGPLAARSRIQLPARRLMIVHAHTLPETASKQCRGRHFQRLSSKIPESHLNAAPSAHELVRRSIGMAS